MTVRLLHFTVQPVLVTDDGTDLTPGPVIQPSQVSFAALADLVDRWPEHLAEIEAQATPSDSTEREVPHA